MTSSVVIRHPRGQKGVQKADMAKDSCKLNHPLRIPGGKKHRRRRHGGALFARVVRGTSSHRVSLVFRIMLMVQASMEKAKASMVVKVLFTERDVFLTADRMRSLRNRMLIQQNTVAGITEREIIIPREEKITAKQATIKLTFPFLKIRIKPIKAIIKLHRGLIRTIISRVVRPV